MKSTYYVDPAGGDDGRNGGSEANAWGSFEPVNARRLGAGDRVYLQPGAYRSTLSISGNGEPGLPIQIFFAPGTYHFFRDGLIKRKLNISNTNDDCDVPKAIAIQLVNAKHVEMKGEGARILCRGKMIELCVDASESVSVEGLRFDYKRPTVSEFKVEETTDNFARLRVHPDSTYRMDARGLVWTGEGWELTPDDVNLGQELDLVRNQLRRCGQPLKGLEIKEQEPGLLIACGAHSMRAGCIYQLRKGYRDCVGVLVNRSRFVTLRDVDFFFMHGMGVLCQFTETITLKRVNIAPEPESGRTCAAWADCMHFSGCKGRLTVEDCRFSGANDDAINVHGTLLRVIESLSSREFRLRFMHRQTFGLMAFNPGDRVRFVRWDSMKTYAPNTISEAQLLSPYEMRIVLADDFDGELQTNDGLENLTWNPDVVVSGCHVERIPTRGFLLTTPGRVRVEDNTFESTWMYGIYISGDVQSWFESGAVRDMMIAKNRFLGCMKAPICIDPNNTAPNTSIHRNISIRENDIHLKSSFLIKAHATSDLSMRDNVIHSAGNVALESILQLRDCEQVDIPDGRNPMDRKLV